MAARTLTFRPLTFIMMYNTFYGLSGMHNPFLMLIFQFQVNVIVKIKMAVQRHLEKLTFELVFIVVELIFSEPKHVLSY